MQCTQCGATVVASARFCPICGQALATTRPTPVAIDPTRLPAGGVPSIHDAPTVVIDRRTIMPTVEPSLSAAEVAALVANMGKSMVVSQWQRWWWKILLIGVALYLALNTVTISTQNAILLPQLLMIGTFLIPIVYIAYLYEDGTLYDVPLSKVALIFFFGGVVGSMTATLLEARLITSADAAGIFGQLTFLNASIVSLSEELAKLMVCVPFLLQARQRYPTVMHGIVLGAAAGMGFAAFESMGYAFSTLVTAGGLEAMHDIIRLRALLAPLGHGTWTAIIAAAMWREYTKGYFPLNSNVLIAFVCSVVLHLLWDYLPPLLFLGLPILHLMLGAIGILLLRFFLMDAKGGQGAAYSERNLAVALRLYLGDLRDDMRGMFRHKQRSSK